MITKICLLLPTKWSINQFDSIQERKIQSQKHSLMRSLKQMILFEKDWAFRVLQSIFSWE